MVHEFVSEFHANDLHVRQDEADGSTTYVIDIGEKWPDAAVDVVDDTLIVVLDESTQYEVSLPAGEASTFINNGILTVEVNQ